MKKIFKAIIIEIFPLHIDYSGEYYIPNPIALWLLKTFKL